MDGKLIGSYRIIEKIGAGGMGEVHRAYDEQLERTVAIKLIRADISDSSTSDERFRREARAVAKLNHPAIVQIYHILEWQGRDCIVMEWVDGQSLSEILRDGPLSLERAIPLALEICEGLTAAHAEGIVHRDLKAGNVMVTSDGHAKILDFGLAKRLSQSETSLSVDGKIVGTLETMSPEQTQGGKIDQRSDLYALGVLIYRMLTGVSPFRGATIQETVARICAHRQPSIHQLNPQIPRPLSEAVDRLLRKSPEERPGSATDLAEALIAAAPSTVTILGTRTIFEAPTSSPLVGLAATEAHPRSSLEEPTKVTSRGEESVGDPSVVAATTPTTAHRSSRRSLWTALGLTALVLVAYFIGRELAPPSEKAATARRSVAVMAFDNLTQKAEFEWMATAVTEMLTTELAIGGQLRTLTGRDLAEARTALGLHELHSLEASDRQRLFGYLGVDLVVSGSYSVVGGENPRLRLDYRLHDADAEDELLAAGETGTEERIFDLVVRMGRRLRQELGVADLSPLQAEELRAALPADTEAARLYTEGLSKLRRLEFVEARDLLRAAVSADPEHPLPHAALAQTWSALGYEDKATNAGKLAMDLATDLSRDERLSIEASAYAAARDWHSAVRTYEALFRRGPDDLNLGLRLAAAQIETDDAAAAIETLGELRALPAPASDDPRIDLLQARAHYRLGALHAAVEYAEKAVRQSESIGAELLVARALSTQVAPLQDLGEQARAETIRSLAQARFEAAGDPRGLSETIELKALSLLEQGECRSSQELLERALEIIREIGIRDSEARISGSLGFALLMQGKLREAGDLLRSTLAAYEDLGKESELATTHYQVGFLLQARGELDDAAEQYEAAQQIYEALGDRDGRADVLTALGEIHYLRGELDGAESLHDAALAVHQETGNKPSEAYELRRKGMIFTARGDLFAARSKYQRALEAQEAAGETGAVAETRLELALLEFFEGHFAEAEEQARQAEEVLRTEGASDLAARASTVIVWTLLTQGQLDEARTVLARAERVAGTSEDLQLRMSVAIVKARLRAASGRAEEIAAALEALDTTARQAATAGYVELDLEARLAAAEIEISTGADASRLTALAEEARAQGYLQIARRAEAIQNPSMAYQASVLPLSNPSLKIGPSKLNDNAST